MSAEDMYANYLGVSGINARTLSKARINAQEQGISMRDYVSNALVAANERATSQWWRISTLVVQYEEACEMERLDIWRCKKLRQAGSSVPAYVEHSREYSTGAVDALRSALVSLGYNADTLDAIRKGRGRK